jgi:hypothetical protein
MLSNIPPNPGSDEALDKGCTCPVLDNAHGRGYMNQVYFWINNNCPLHGGSISNDSKPRHSNKQGRQVNN